MGKASMIRVAGNKVGIVGLDEVLEDMAPAYAARTDAEVAEEMLRRLSSRNYIPETVRDRYAAAFVREFRRHLGQPCQDEERRGLEIKVLGAGCPRCHQLRERVLKVLDRLELAAEVEEVTEAMEIAALGVVTPPGLIVNDKVVSVGKVPSEGQISDWLKEAAD